MRCEECGHDLNGIADTAPCPECGVVTPAARRVPRPLPGGWRMALAFAWPAIAVMGIAFVSLALAPVIDIDQAPGTIVFIVFVNAVLVLVFLLGPLNSALRVHGLLKRMPRRVRAAPLLLLIPRGVMVPVLAGLATIPIMAAIAFGGCLMVVLGAEANARRQSDARINSVQQPPVDAAPRQGATRQLQGPPPPTPAEGP